MKVTASNSPLSGLGSGSVEQPLLGSHIEAEETHTLPPTEGPPDLGNHASLSIRDLEAAKSSSRSSRVSLSLLRTQQPAPRGLLYPESYDRKYWKRKINKGLKIWKGWDFSGSPLVEMLCFQRKGMGLIADWEPKIPHATWPKKG